ncbi:uncharacterized protein PF3D7_1120000-like [Saccostrea echinata]|uniref:uncharacterized protein PF3D7_1120000-like n=1 Tax=Saccostrea echinata TaxID=191078 RepID=UPI002A80C8C2|nr:uncharacterized protein PF3D7_1120000-like [Saccostrea echinata]
MSTKEMKDTKAGRSNTKQTMDKGRPSLSLSSVSAEVKGQVVSIKPASKQRRTSSAGDQDDNSEMDNIKVTLSSIQETLKKLATKDDIKDLVKSVIMEVKEELKKKMKEELKEEIKEEIKVEMLQELKTEMHQDLDEDKSQHGQELSKMRQQLSDKVDSLMMDNDTNMGNVSQLKKRISYWKNSLKKQMELPVQQLAWQI